jgi:hypothetical protein
MIMLDDVHYLAFKSVVSDGVALIAELNSRTDDAVNLCTFCLTTCQQCEMLFLTTEGLIACELNADGFLTGVEIVLCPVCKSIEDLDAKIEHDGNTKWRSCLSNTTNSFKNDAFSTFDSKSEAQE